MQSSHLFCPKSGALLTVNAEKGVVECASSGYSKSIAGAPFGACASHKEVSSPQMRRQRKLARINTGSAHVQISRVWSSGRRWTWRTCCGGMTWSPS